MVCEAATLVRNPGGCQDSAGSPAGPTPPWTCIPFSSPICSRGAASSSAATPRPNAKWKACWPPRQPSPCISETLTDNLTLWTDERRIVWLPRAWEPRRPAGRLAGHRHHARQRPGRPPQRRGGNARRFAERRRRRAPQQLRSRRRHAPRAAGHCRFDQRLLARAGCENTAAAGADLWPGIRRPARAARRPAPDRRRPPPRS